MSHENNKGLMYVIHKYDERISVALEKYKGEIEAYNDGYAHSTNAQDNNLYDIYTFSISYGGPWGKKEWHKTKPRVSKSEVNDYMTSIGITSVWTGVELRTKEDNMGCFMFVKVVNEGVTP